VRHQRTTTATASACLIVVLSVAGSALDARTFVLEVAAGAYDRHDTPVVWMLPGNLRGRRELSLARIDGDRRVPIDVQRIEGAEPALCFVLDGKLAAGQTRRYELNDRRQAAPGATVGTYVECTNDGKAILFRVGGRRVMSYNHAIVPAPEGAGSHHDRSGYIHPAFSPQGVLVTNDFPKKHVHHHGIWFPWKYAEFEGRKVNFWETGAKQGRIEHVRLDAYGGGRVLGWLRADQRFVDLTAPDGPKAALLETWSVRVWAVPGGSLFDLEAVQSCVGSTPFTVKKNHYGGLGLRGSGQWEGPDRCGFLTSEGRTRKDGHATQARWCDVYGTVDGRPAGITVLCHPENLRAPQNMRIHPSEPFFNFAPCQQGDFTIEPGKPLVSRYRFRVWDGEPDARRSEQTYTDWTDPPSVRIVKN